MTENEEKYDAAETLATKLAIELDELNKLHAEIKVAISTKQQLLKEIRTYLESTK